MSGHVFACRSLVGSAPQKSSYGVGGMQDRTGKRNTEVDSSFLSGLAIPPPSPAARGHLLLPGRSLSPDALLAPGEKSWKGHEEDNFHSPNALFGPRTIFLDCPPPASDVCMSYPITGPLNNSMSFM